MSVPSVPVKPSADVEVLREMVRLAENRRKEELEHIERVNRYNLALIAFSGSFLSLLVSIDFHIIIVRVAGLFLSCSTLCSLMALRPRTLKGGTIVVEDDVRMLREGRTLPLEEYLLELAHLTDRIATNMTLFAKEKKKWTIVSAALLASALIITYILYAYA